MMTPRQPPDEYRRRRGDHLIIRAGKFAVAIAAIIGLTTATLSALGWSRFDAQKSLAAHELSMGARYHQIDSSLASVNHRVDAVEDLQAKLNRRQLLMNYLQCTREVSADKAVRNLCTEVIRDWLNQ